MNQTIFPWKNTLSFPTWLRDVFLGDREARKSLERERGVAKGILVGWRSNLEVCRQNIHRLALKTTQEVHNEWSPHCTHQGNWVGKDRLIILEELSIWCLV